MSKIDHEIDILIELHRLETLYYHYRNMYRKLCIFCNSNDKSSAKLNRDTYKSQLKAKRLELKRLRSSSQINHI